MAFNKRIVKLLIPGGTTLIPVVKNVSKHGVKKGITEAKKEIESDAKEALKTSIFSKKIYELGLYDGQKQGYIDSSTIYEEKLRRQSIEFLTKEIDHKADLTELNTLLEGLETYIEFLQQKVDITEQENKNLKEAVILENRLKQVM
ncbi:MULTISPECIES: hypothetical protein [Exiguobacterium]|uniref:hypothetical protein n=1 Tax=Exiguobacterium TaxID=33986 RepID=UPI0009910F3A|nr:MULTISPECIES: hypothetical protein [Exiguobacterium]